MKETIHTTVGLYRDGSFKINGVLPEHLKDHVKYNKEFRFGRALFIDGKCVYAGYLTKQQTKAFELKIETDNLKAKECTQPYE